MQKVAWAFRFIFLLFVSFGASAEFIDGTRSIVSDRAILHSDIGRLRERLTKVPALAAAYRLDPKTMTDAETLDRLVEEMVLEVSAKELDIVVTDSEVESQIQNIARMNGMSRPQLEASLKNEGIPLDAYKSNIRSQLLRRNVFDRELRRGGGVSEAELRDLYNQSAPVEIKLFLVTGEKAALEVFGREVNSETKPFSEQLKRAAEIGVTDLGWISPQNLSQRFQGILKTAQPGRAYGPVASGKSFQLLLVEANRRGSDEGFAAAKNELVVRAQNEDFEKRFASWIERRKQELNVVVKK